jgi:hypothetical protein
MNGNPREANIAMKYGMQDRIDDRLCNHRFSPEPAVEHRPGAYGQLTLPLYISEGVDAHDADTETA